MNRDAPLHLSIHGDLTVVRDDQLTGGTKTRAIDTLLEGAADQVVYASPAYGYAQIALAHAAAATGREAHIFVAQRKTLHPRTQEAADAGATIHQHRPGYLTQIQARARDFTKTTGATLLPFGFDTPDFQEALTGAITYAINTTDDQAITTPEAREAWLRLQDPTEVWIAAGSGTVSRALQDVWPAADHHAVAVGRPPNPGRATVHQAPEPFSRDARTPPPYPATSNFDAKVWQFARHRGPGTVIWNVAA